MYTEKITTQLKSFDIDSNRGFLPAEDPLQTLPKAFHAWDQLAQNFTAYINAQVIKEKINQLPLLDSSLLETKPELERAMLLLTCFAHGYIHFEEGEKELPENISIPLDAIAKRLGRFPILSHASLVLNNWRRLDKNKAVSLDNITTLIQFNGGLDEAWFYLITTNMEQVGAPALSLLLEAYHAAQDGNSSIIIKSLEELSVIFKALKSALERMYEQLDPHIFYKRIRPWLDSFEQIRYTGCHPEMRHYHGGSAAQSSLLQSFDAALGMDYSRHKKTKDYLVLMRSHMPPKHADFIHFLEEQSTIQDFANKDLSVKAAYQKAVEALIELRNEHLKMVAIYVVKEAAKYKQEATGTGGTSPLVFLKSIRNSNQETIDGD